MRTAFFEFLSSEYSSENLCFWLSCEKYRKIKNNDERFKEGQEIYTQYISNNSPLQVNIKAYDVFCSSVSNSEVDDVRLQKSAKKFLLIVLYQF